MLRNFEGAITHSLALSLLNGVKNLLWFTLKVKFIPGPSDRLWLSIHIGLKGGTGRRWNRVEMVLLNVVSNSCDHNSGWSKVYTYSGNSGWKCVSDVRGIEIELFASMTSISVGNW